MEPKSVTEAQVDHRWVDAMKHEIDSLNDSNVLVMYNINNFIYVTV